LTGSDTAFNVLIGGVQKVAADQLGLSPNLMGAANSSDGVMGKMSDAQSILVAWTATRWFNHEGDILRHVLLHSIAPASLFAAVRLGKRGRWPLRRGDRQLQGLRPGRNDRFIRTGCPAEHRNPPGPQRNASPGRSGAALRQGARARRPVHDLGRAR